MTKTTEVMMVAASLIVGLTAGVPAFAAKSVPTDSFSITTGKAAATTGSATGAAAAKKDVTKPLGWFEAIDDMVASHKPTSADRVILSRQFKQEAERVQEWIDTATKVVKNYRELSTQLRALPVPENMPSAKDYRDLSADWYNDAADIYEDLIRPRKPAKTIEELDDRIDKIKERAQSLHQTNINLKSMDQSLRRAFKVHPSKHDDALQQYVRSR